MNFLKSSHRRSGGNSTTLYLTRFEELEDETGTARRLPSSAFQRPRAETGHFERIPTNQNVSKHDRLHSFGTDLHFSKTSSEFVCSEASNPFVPRPNRASIIIY